MKRQIKQLGYWYFGFFLMAFVLRIINGLTLTQLGQNSIYIPRQDPLLWIFQLLNLPNLFTQSLPLFIDIVLPILAMVALFLLRKEKSIRGLMIVFILLWWAYLLTVFSYPTLSIRKYLGLALIPLLFLFDKKRAAYVWEVLRYYIFFVFSSSALWKIFRGSFWHSDQMTSILEGQHTPNVIHYPEAWISKFGVFLLDHPNMSNILFDVATIFQLSFIIGFFTKKYDKILAVFLILFVVADYGLMWIEYWEFLVFLPLLWWPHVQDKSMVLS